MSKVFVQFSDSTKKEIISIFSCPQDDVAFPHQGVIDDSDKRYIAFTNHSESKGFKLNAIKVTTSSGNVFDGNAAARSNLTSAILAHEQSETASVKWKMADNSVEEVTISELREALVLSVQIAGEILTE